ncbi:MAG: hypothetical protein WCR98_02825 [Saccharofermentanales bacterium]
MQLRRDTAANWTSADPTLAAGEFGYETDTSKFKVGDGSTAWTSLAYAGTAHLTAEEGVQLTSGTIKANVSGLTEDSTPADGDFVMTYDVDASAHKKVQLKNLPGGGSGGDTREFILLRDVKANNTGGGTFTAGAWQTRTLNEKTNDDGNNCTLSSNEFTLAAGTYELWASCPAYQVVENKARLYNVSDSTVVAIGQNTRTASYVQNHAMVVAKFTIASSKTFRIEHRCSATVATVGFGNPNNFGCDEVYTVVAIWKVE